MPTEKRNSSQQSTPRGWRMDPIPSRPAYKDVDGNIRIPVWLAKNGRHMADMEMILLPSEAQLLSERLTDAMGGARSILQELFHSSAVTEGPGVTVVPKLRHSV